MAACSLSLHAQVHFISSLISLKVHLASHFSTLTTLISSLSTFISQFTSHPLSSLPRCPSHCSLVLLFLAHCAPSDDVTECMTNVLATGTLQGGLAFEPLLWNVRPHYISSGSTPQPATQLLVAVITPRGDVAHARHDKEEPPLGFT